MHPIRGHLLFPPHQVSAEDKDGALNNQVTYSIVGGNRLGHFAVHPKGGQIHVAKSLDREEVSDGPWGRALCGLAVTVEESGSTGRARGRLGSTAPKVYECPVPLRRQRHPCL